jgi:membrane protein
VGRWGRSVGALGSAVGSARGRYRAVDHLWRAAGRYDELLCGRLAAAIAYYGFFAVFALALVAYSAFGFLLPYDLDLLDEVRRFLRENLPLLNADAIEESRRTVGVVGLLGLIFTGIGWVEAIRSSQRLIWDVDQQPGNVVVRHLVDLAVLVGALLLMAASVITIDGLEALLVWLADGRIPAALTAVGWALAVVVNMLLAVALLAAVPRLRMSPRRLGPPVLLVAVGVTLLNTVGRSFVSYARGNPAYAVVGGTVGLLIYLYVFNQLLLFGAALAATSRHGRVRDLSHRRRPVIADPSSPH